MSYFTESPGCQDRLPKKPSSHQKPKPGSSQREKMGKKNLDFHSEAQNGIKAPKAGGAASIRKNIKRGLISWEGRGEVKGPKPRKR